jgi:hypothetical protein
MVERIGKPTDQNKRDSETIEADSCGKIFRNLKLQWEDSFL